MPDCWLIMRHCLEERDEDRKELEDMRNFKFASPTEFLFGKETERNVGAEVKKYGKKVLVHYGGGHIKKNGLYDRVMESLKEQDIEITELGGVKANPDIGLVREGIALCKEKQVEVILAVGGGSVIDSAKAIGIGVYYEGDVWDFFLKKVPVERMMPLGVVLTIPATGSEASNTTVVTNSENGHLKRALSHSLLRPAFAVMNPELTYSLPAYQTAAGGVDIMSHVLERYFTREPGCGLTDRLCEATLKTMIRQLPAALEEPENYEARAEIMWAGTIAHNGILGVGRSEDWGSHMMGHELSAFYDMTHGATLAIMIPRWMEYVYQTDVPRFVKYAADVWGVEHDVFHPEKTALEGIHRTKEFFRSLGMPVSFADAGIGAERIDEMAENCTRFGAVGGFVKLEKEDCARIYRAALE